MAASALLGLATLFIYAILLIPFTPSIADLRKAKTESPSVLMSEDGKELAVFKRLNRKWVELDEISPHVIKALIATEDHRFYEHHGVDLKRTAAGILRTLQGDPEGGSTLTQQLARNLYPEEIGRRRTITRKLKELITALKIEYAYSKDEILLTYLNTMPFLYNAFGIEMGARTYFDKPAAKLNVLESATLIGMLKGTSYYNPVLNGERAVKRRNVVLSQMLKRGALSRTEFDNLKNRPLRLDFERQPEPVGRAPHLAAHVRKWLVDWADRNDYNLYSDGLVVISTVDSRLQAFASQAIERHMDALQAVADVEWGLSSPALISTNAATYRGMRRHVQPWAHWWRTQGALVDSFVRESSAYRSLLAAGTAPEQALAQLKKDAVFLNALRAEKTRLETGFVALDPGTGHVKAWVGSRDHAVDQFDHVAQAKRQPGSTFKPFVYGAALEKGMTPSRRFVDREVEIELKNGSIWRPGNASGISGREMTLHEGLAYSKNTITAQVMQEVGPAKVAAFARRLGVSQSTLDEVPALSLGTSPVSLLEMATAYGTIASGGEMRKPILVSRILDKDGKLLETFTSEPERAMSARTAEDLTDMLRGVITRGTGRAIRSQYGLHADVAGKTGTTQNNTDGWFILMHPRLVAGSWVGFNDARVAMRSSYWGQGAQTALPVVGDTFRQAVHARLIDNSTRFPTAPEPFLTALWTKVSAWFDREKPKDEVPARPSRPRPAAPPAPSAPPPTERIPEDVPDMHYDEMQRIIEQARNGGMTLPDGMPAEIVLPDGTVLVPVYPEEGRVFIAPQP
ncbi:transglycosylase domain-containing protein [Noviherbaspirillum sp. CPCC 100848]|uniref:Transglycosylase domain-containing protein n=1 Tax=Noviherbaspirillum album TaxID=3080276 RepID=A0ABU6JBK7_9BURK|nr:transglycosylase domain-containing protein [Noviherbaspirillum sp. CPCC 100848]MEC4720930.1 transglycosylase domain-containing protein [Noviherbaspirillum sp. CPCC 100848]